MAKTSYALALGSNRRSGYGSPAQTLRAALAALGELGDVQGASTIRTTAAVGPAGRSFANAAALLTTHLNPPDLLDVLKELERGFGRRAGRRWGARVLDLDILLWSQGPYADARLIVPHREMRERGFVLEPLAQIAPNWRDPLSGATVRQLLHRLRRRRGQRDQKLLSKAVAFR